MANTLKFGNGEWYGKKDTILAYNDENSNYKPLPFNFSRDSKATVINKDGLIETVGSGEPRIDYLNDSKGALLLEPSRTNLVTYSENLSDSSWSKSQSSATLSNITSPKGTQNVYKFTENTASSKHQLFTTISSYTELTISFFAKKEERSFIAVEKSGWGNTIFDLNIGSVVSGTGDVIDFGNGWFRCSASYTASPAQTQFYLILMQDSNTNNYQGDGNSGLYLWGIQAETGSYPTSIIKTQGSSVTRLADSCSQTPPSGVIGQTEGAIYFEFEDLDYSYTSIARAISLSDGTSANRIYIAQLSSGAMYAITTGGCEIQETAPSGRRGNLKVAFGYKNNDCVLYVNGVLSGVDNSATTPICSKVHLGNFNSTANLNKPYKEVKIYNTRLSNAELQALTT